MEGVLYISAVLEGYRRTKTDVSDTVGISEVTLRKRYHEITEALGIRDEAEKKAEELDKKPA